MANQSPDRREILQMIALAAAASRYRGFARWVCAPQHAAEASPQARPKTYQPQFFTPDEFAAIDQISELIIPKDETPGARDAGVAEFIDFMVSNDPEIQWPFRYGLDWLNARATELHATGFINLPEEHQIELLRTISGASPAGAGADGPRFFALIRQYTVMGYYTSRIGLEELDYPGLKFYSESPACPHTGDPEHRHLPPPRF